MRLFRALDISASGLTAERLRLDIISNNLANANTTRTETGEPYRRQRALFAARPEPTFMEALQQAAGAGFAGPRPRLAAARTQGGQGMPLGGVQVTAIVSDPGPFRLVYDPGHPDADPDGYVAMPNINPVTEMVDLITASRSYEANVTAINAAKQMFSRALEIGRG